MENQFKNHFNNLKNRLPIALSLDTSDLLKFDVILKNTYEKIGFLKLNPAYVDISTIFTNQLKTILDLKCSDVPHNMEFYRKKYFYDISNRYHSVTLDPYCGYNSMKSFVDDKNIFSFIWTISTDEKSVEWQKPFINKVFKTDIIKNHIDNVGLICPSNNIEFLKKVRELFPNTILLVTGIGTQGGNIKNVKKAIGNKDIIYSIGRRLIESKNLNNELKKIESEIYG